MIKKRFAFCRCCEITLCLQQHIGVYIMMNGFLFRAFACIFVPFLMMASSVESYASDEDLVGKVKSEGTCDDGFFNVWKYKHRYWFEIPDSLFGRDMLLVTCRARTSMDMGFRSESIDERVFVWEKRGG